LVLRPARLGILGGIAMQIDASTIAATTSRTDLIRAAASANRSHRTFNAQVLGQGARAQSLSFKSTLDRVSLSAEAKAPATASHAATVGAGSTATPTQHAKPESAPLAKPATLESMSSTYATYAKPKPVPETLPPVTGATPRPSKEVTGDTTFDVSAATGVIGGQAETTASKAIAESETSLPASVVMEQILSAFGAIEGDESYEARLDFDGDGLIGLSDLNRVLFQG
jgi:hypothetical protein